MRKALGILGLAACMIAFSPSWPTQLALGSPGPDRSCSTQRAVVNLAVMTGTPSFIWSAPDALVGKGLATLFITLVDANNSITRVDTTCTDSTDRSATDFVPQVCDDLGDGICVETPAGVWRKTTTGSMRWSRKIDIEGDPSFECTFAVGVGSATAVSDTITVDLVVCTK